MASADRNFIGAYEKLVEHQAAGSVQRFGPVTAFVSALPISFLNGCIVVEPAIPADLSAAIDWLDERGYPYEIWIREGLVGDASADLPARGFEQRPWLMPGMAIRPRPEPPSPADGITVRQVRDEAGLEEHIGLMRESGVPEKAARAMYARSFATDPDVRIFTAYLDGRPVGNSIAIRTGAVAGVYAVGTRPEARRRGVGTAVTWAAVCAGHAWGCSTVVLQSSEMGFPVYTAMGFEVIVRYAVFHRGSPG